MEHFITEVSFHHEPEGKEFVKKVIRTTIILSVITIIELLLGLSMYAFPMAALLKLFLKGVIVILSLAKAFYIVGVFMHLGDEVKNLIMTIVLPLLIFVWFIGAFLYEGSSWKNLRNTYNKAPTVTAPAESHSSGEHH